MLTDRRSGAVDGESRGSDYTRASIGRSVARDEAGKGHESEVDLIKQKRATSDDHLFCFLMDSTGRLPPKLLMISTLPGFC